MDNDGCFPLVAFVIVLALSLWGGYGLGSISCAGQWRDSGMKYRYEFIGGCQVSPDGRVWLPADNYREMTR